MDRIEKDVNNKVTKFDLMLIMISIISIINVVLLDYQMY